MTIMSTIKITLSAAAALAMVGMTAQTASAAPGKNFRHFGTHTPGIDRRIQNQARRIFRGRRSGQLTRFEAFRLRGKLRQIRRARWFAKSDGRVEFFERRGLHEMLDRNSRRIFRLKNNGRVAGFRGRFIDFDAPVLRRNIRHLNAF